MTTMFTTAQAGFRGYLDDGAINAATAIAGLNAPWPQDVDTNFRIRFLLQETAGAGGDFVPQLQYQLNGGGYVNVTATSNVVRCSVGTPADGAVTTSLLSGTGTFASGAYDEVDGLSGTHTVVASGNTEAEFCVQIRSADVADGDTVNLRVLGKSNATTALDAYTQTPALTVNEGLPPVAVVVAAETDTATTITPSVSVSGSIPVGRAASARAIFDTRYAQPWVQSDTWIQTQPWDHAFPHAVETDTAPAILRVQVRQVTSESQDTATAVVADTGGGGQTIAVSAVTDSGTATAVGRLHTKVLGVAAETGTPGAVGKQHTKVFTAAGGTDAAQPISAAGEITITVQQAVVTATAAAITRVKTRLFGVAYEVDEAQTMTVRVVTACSSYAECTTPAAADTAPEVDDATTLVHAKTRAAVAAGEVGRAAQLSVPAWYAPEVDSAAVIGGRKTAPVGAAAATGTAEPVAEPSVTVIAVDGAAEQDVASRLPQPLLNAAEAGTSATVTSAGNKNIAVGAAADTSAATIIAGRHTAALVVAAQTDAAATLGARKTAAVTGAVSAGTAAAIPGRKTITIGAAAEVAVATTIGSRYAIALPAATQTDAATAVSARKTTAVTAAAATGTATTVTRRKTTTTGNAAESNTATPVGGGKTLTVTAAAELNTAAIITRSKTRTVLVASESDTANTVAPAGQTFVPVTASVETDRARVLLPATKPGRETDTAAVLRHAKTRIVAVAAQVNTATVVHRSKSRTVAAGSDIGTAGVVSPKRLLLAATAVDTAAVMRRAHVRALLASAEIGSAQLVGRLKQLGLPAVSEVDSAGSVTFLGVLTLARIRVHGHEPLTSAASREPPPPVTGRERSLTLAGKEEGS